jgi:hypothetical protein
LLDESKKVLTLHRSHGLDQKEQQVKSFHNIKPFGHCLVRKGTFITIDEVLSDKDLRLQRQHTPFICEMVFAPLEIKSEALAEVINSRDPYTGSHTMRVRQRRTTPLSPE